MSSRDWKRMLRGLVTSRNRIIVTTVIPPVVMPLDANAAPTEPRFGSVNRSNWKAAPIQKEMPAAVSFCLFCSD